MRITEPAWVKFINDLRKTNEAAAEKIKKLVSKMPDWTDEKYRDALIEYAYGVSTRYGEAAAELACEMYDDMVTVSGKNFPPAVPANTAEYGDVAKAVNGIAKQSNNIEMLAAAIGRQVKMAGVDTTMQNALRDGAEWAWIPHGDTCAFCLTLASRGWQRASKNALKNGHAEHIHANCDCTYAIRFNGKTEVEGYDPDYYRSLYYGADLNGQSATPKNRINAMRREFYARNKKIVGPNTSASEELLKV